MTNPGIYGYPRATGTAVRPVPRRVLDLVADYGVHTNASAGANTTAVQQAFSDAATLNVAGVGCSVYLRGAGAPYPVNTLTLPSEPIAVFGDGPTTSTFSTIQGTILTYSPSTNDVYGTNDPWSQNSPALGGSGTAVHYRSKYWMLTGLGFTKADNWGGNSGIGLDFSSNWSLGGLSYGVHMYMADCLITNFNGTGISYIINGLRGESKFLRVMVDGCKNEGVIYGSDQMWVNCCSNNNGYEGFWADGRNGQLVACKAYSNGVLNHTSRNAGFYYTNNSGGALINACYAQDNNGPGLQLHTAHLVSVNGFVADRNCQSGTSDVTNQAGVLMEDCTSCSIDGLVATDSSSGRPNTQQHALRVTNTSGTTCNNNRVRLVQYQTVQAITDPVDTGSDLNGTDVTVGGSDGGRYTLTYGATLTPNPYLAQTNYCVLTGNVTTIAAPANQHHGCRLRLMLLASGGSRTVPALSAWLGGTAIKANGTLSSTTGTTGQRLIVDFEYDAANSLWIQTSPANPTWF